MEEKKYMLCIDNGLTVGKVALVDASGCIAGISSFKNEVINKGFFSEVNMELLYKKTADAIRSLILKTKIKPVDIISVGNSGHGGGIYLLDRLGNPLRNAITSMDSRAESLIIKWVKEGVNSYSKTYTNMWNGQAIPLLYWLKENERKNYNRVAKILFCKDWIKFKLTRKYSTDYTDASNAGLVNLNTKNYDIELYKLYDLVETFERLPELNRSEETIGYITKATAEETGLKEGTPVIGGLVDFIACLIGSGIYNCSYYSIVAGTWGINSALIDKLLMNPEVMSTIIFPNDKNYLVMDTSPTSAVNLEWFLSKIIEEIGINMNRNQLYKKIDEEIEKIDIKKFNIFYLPFIYNSKLSNKLQGAFLGFNAANNIYDFLYSIYEGVIFAHLMHLNNLKKGGIICSKATISGGAANSNLWCQMFADILNLDIVTTSVKEVGILGLAIIQAVGMGIYKSIKEAVDNMVKIKNVYKPNKEKAKVYLERFKKFEKIKDSLEGLNKF